MRTAMLLANTGSWLVLLGAAGVLLAPLGFRFGWWDYAFALRKVLAFASIASAAGFILCLAAWLLGGATKAPVLNVRLIAALALGALITGYVLLQIKQVRGLPMIHDITTDTVRPAQFVTLASVRRAAPNGFNYGGARIAQQQKAAYPDIAPFESAQAPHALFDQALAAARAAGWTIAAAERDEGRIEATASTRIFGFKDDIVLRISPSGSGSVLDMRSMSRVGISDVGANARRIRTFLATLRRQ